MEVVEVKKISKEKMTKKLTPMKAIKLYCKNSCCSKDLESWQECNIIKCPLFIFRLGKKIKK